MDSLSRASEQLLCTAFVRSHPNLILSTWPKLTLQSASFLCLSQWNQMFFGAEHSGKIGGVELFGGEHYEEGRWWSWWWRWWWSGATFRRRRQLKILISIENVFVPILRKREWTFSNLSWRGIQLVVGESATTAASVVVVVKYICATTRQWLYLLFVGKNWKSKKR